VCTVLEEYGLPLVADPVMFAKGGHALLEPEAVSAVQQWLIPLATVLTPNIPEAEALIDRPITGIGDMPDAAKTIAELGAAAVLLKGGHLEGDELSDILYTNSGVQRWDDTRIDTAHTHGTGCTLASAVATGMAQGLTLPKAVDRARAYVRDAILNAPGLGKGHGPLGHGHTVSPYPNT
jgi:hydroxymethylpyrimidine/phosphomethylpyrimidine kinase